MDIQLRKIYGIDLGTTYSCIAKVDEHQKALIINNSDGSSTTPSVVYFESPQNIVVGQAAKENALVMPSQVVSLVKRFMGNPDATFEFFDKTYTPQEISALILKKVVGDAEKEVGEKIEDVVITCPAYFGAIQKEATKQAGILAGLNVIEVIPEPTAAALSYGFSQKGQDQTILVYDLGGGTFDITMIKINQDQITVLSTGGDHELGGADWDGVLVQHMLGLVSQESGLSFEEISKDEEFVQEINRDAEDCKRRLSAAEVWKKNLRFQGTLVKVEITREFFEQATKHLLERSISLTEELLSVNAHLGTPSKILLVGGSTYMPQVMSTVTQRFPTLEVVYYEPNQAVAKGAALYGLICLTDKIEMLKSEIKIGEDNVAISGSVNQEAQVITEDPQMIELIQLALAGNIKTRKVVNVTSKSIGIEVIADGQTVVTNLVKRDQALPIQVIQKFPTHADGQEDVQIKIYENQSYHLGGKVPVDECVKLTEAILKFEKPLPKGSPIQISTEVTKDGLFKIHAKDLTTNKDIEIEQTIEGLMSESEIEEAIENIGGMTAE